MTKVVSMTCPLGWSQLRIQSLKENQNGANKGNWGGGAGKSLEIQRDLHVLRKKNMQKHARITKEPRYSQTEEE